MEEPLEKVSGLHALILHFGLEVLRRLVNQRHHIPEHILSARKVQSFLQFLEVVQICFLLIQNLHGTIESFQAIFEALHQKVGTLDLVFVAN